MGINVKIRKAIYIRTGPGKSFEPPVGSISPSGNVIVMNGIEKGEAWRGVSDWYYQINDKGEKLYYWGGGIDVNDSTGSSGPITLTSILNYNQAINNIPDNWRNTLGADVVVAIIDTGLSALRASNFNVIKTYDSINDIVDGDVNDNISGHGTFVAGIIGANGKQDKNIIGLAPRAQFIIIRASNSGSFGSNEVGRGIDWLLNKCPVKPDIINLSCDFPVATNGDFFESAFSKLANQNTTVLAAGGNNDDIFQSSLIYPANAPNVLAVASLKAPNTVQGTLSSKVAYIVSQQNFVSLGNTIANPYSSDWGSSFATALTTGALALAISFSKHNAIGGTPLNLLQQQIQSFDSSNFTTNTQILKI